MKLSTKRFFALAGAALCPLFADTPITDAPLENFQIELLDLAFKSASAIPNEPHAKDRAKAQEAVVTVSLELNQAQRALSQIEKIDGWRRGNGYANLAFYCAQHGNQKEASQYLEQAEQISKTAEDWRKDRILTKIAQVRAMRVDAESFDKQMKEIDAAIATGNFDLQKNALDACAELFNQVYENKEKRTQAEEKIKSSWKKLPLMIRIDVMNSLIKASLSHKDESKALELVKETQTIVDGAQWNLEDRIRLASNLAELRYLAGDKQKARSDADALLVFFDSQKEKITDIYRATALCALAEAYLAMGDSTTALAVYAKAVEEGVHNPNSRPRAEDLSAISRSMAQHQAKPDEKLWTRMNKIFEALGQPW